MASFPRDDNRIAALGGVTDDANQTATALIVDPTTGRLKVSATISSNLGDLGDVNISGGVSTGS